MPLKTRPSSPYLWCRFKFRGREVFVSTGTAVRRDAEAFERRLRTQLEDEAEIAKPQRDKHTLADVAGLDIDRALREGVEQNTINTYHKVHWKHLVAHYGADRDPDTIDTLAVEQYVTARLQQSYKYGAQQVRGIRRQTIKKELGTLKRGLKLARRRKWVREVPDEWPSLSKDQKDKKKAGKLRDPALVQKWLDIMDGKAEPARDEAIFAIMTGLRAAEIKRIRPEWVEKTPDLPVPAVLNLEAMAAKTRDDRLVGLTAEALAIVERAKKRGSEDGTLFGPESRRNTYRRASEAIGVHPSITLRDLRHTHSTLALAKGKDLTALMAAMGHKNVSTTMLYQHADRERAAGVAASFAQAFREKVEQSGWSTKKRKRATKRKP